jgi:hypothetical protein
MFGAFVSRIKRKSLIISLFLSWYCFCIHLYVTICMKLDPGMHIVMHLVFFGKTGLTMAAAFLVWCGLFLLGLYRRKVSVGSRRLLWVFCRWAPHLFTSSVFVASLSGVSWPCWCPNPTNPHFVYLPALMFQSNWVSLFSISFSFPTYNLSGV